MDSKDNDLLILLSTDLDGYFDQLVLHYQQKLYIFVVCMIHNHLDAEEIVQDTFVHAYKAFKKKPQMEQRIILRPWLFKIAYNLTINYVTRSASYRYQWLSLDMPKGRRSFEETEHGQYLSPEQQMEDQETNRELYEAIDKLSDVLRTPVVLHFVVGLQYPEIAGILDQSINTVKSNGRRGLKKLHAILCQCSLKRSERGL